MKQKLLLALSVLTMGMCLLACGQTEDSGIVVSEYVREWCEKHDVDPGEFGVAWLQKQTWDTEKKELELTIDYPVDVANAYQLFDDYYEWDIVNELETVPEQVLNDEILIRGFGWGVGLKSWQFDGKGPVKYYNDILNINFSNFADPGPEENIISVREAYEKGWIYFAISPAAIGLSNDYLFAQDEDTIRQYLDEIIETCGSPDYIYASSQFDTVADMTAFASIGVDGENYSKSRVVNSIFYDLVYEYDEYVLYVDVVQENVGYDTKEGTIESMFRPNLFLYTYEFWNAYQEKNTLWSLHPVK